MEAKIFKTIRQLNALTQSEAAKRLGVSRSILAMVETEKVPISRKLECKIVDCFGFEQLEQVKKAMDIFGGSDD
jgi:DNA-binding XRE family transcriptional regulator